MNRNIVHRLSLLYLAMTLSGPAVADTDAPKPAPCSSAENAEFDFWVGDWKVSLPDGKPAGTSHVEKILGGCVVFENWYGAGGAFAGKSFNTWDPRQRTWNQVWVDNAGSTIHFSGTRKGDVMDMSGTDSTDEGTVYYQMSYTLNADGTVRQLWQQSSDGEQWETIFDGLYRRMSAGADAGPG